MDEVSTSIPCKIAEVVGRTVLDAFTGRLIEDATWRKVSRLFAHILVEGGPKK